MTNAQKSLLAIAGRPAHESKKWRAMIHTFTLLMLVFAVGCIIMLLNPQLAPALVSILQFLIPSIAGVGGWYSHAQGGVDKAAAEALGRQ